MSPLQRRLRNRQIPAWNPHARWLLVIKQSSLHMSHPTRSRAGRQKSKAKMAVVFGCHTVKAFVAAPKDFDVVGIVILGIEYGLLAVTSTGSYVRVNGSTVQRLNQDQVRDAIATMRAHGRGSSFAASRNALVANVPPKCGPTVVMRKRRKIDPNCMRVETRPNAD